MGNQEAKPGPEQKQKPKSSRLITCFLTLEILLILLAIAIPNFFRSGSRSKYGEAHQNLRAISTAYQVYFSDYNTFPSAPFIKRGDKTYNCFSIANWEPKGKIIYTYECMGTPVYWPGWDKGKPAPSNPCPASIKTNATQIDFTIAACGNIDRDPTIDVWTVDTTKHMLNFVNDYKE